MTLTLRPHLWRGGTLLLLACFVTLAAIGKSHGGTIAEKKAIQSVLDKQIEAWNRGDIDGFMAGYWQSPELVYLGNSKLIRGWQPLLESMRRGYQKPGVDMGTLELNEEEIVMLSNDSAIVWGKYRVTTKDGKQSGGLYTLAVRKLSDGWRTVYDRTSVEKQ